MEGKREPRLAAFNSYNIQYPFSLRVLSVPRLLSRVYWHRTVRTYVKNESPVCNLLAIPREGSAAFRHCYNDEMEALSRGKLESHRRVEGRGYTPSRAPNLFAKSHDARYTRDSPSCLQNLCISHFFFLLCCIIFFRLPSRRARARVWTPLCFTEK